MAIDLSAFQFVLEALEAARARGGEAAAADGTTRETDDQDAYPHGIELYLERTDPAWHSIRFLSKHLDWVHLETRTKRLSLRPTQELGFHNARIAFQEAAAEELRSAGIECASDVYYR